MPVPSPLLFLNLITEAGDSGVLLPLALVSAAMLWLYHSSRAAWLLLRSVLAACTLIALLKLLLLACGAHWHIGQFGQTSLVSPSGHACLSAAVYGSLGSLVAAGRPVLARLAIGVLVFLLVGTIAVSRVALGVHSWAEVLVGLLVGLSAQLVFAYSYFRAQPLRIDLKIFAMTISATVLLAFGVRIPAESLIRHLAKHMSESCQAPLPQVEQRAA